MKASLTQPLKAPFPYFGGKSKIAAKVWQRLGNPRNYIEPFCGSAAMLLSRGVTGKFETVNVSNAFIANFWRAVASEPATVAMHADWPVNEVDLHARHRWLLESEQARRCLVDVRETPDYYDPKVAGWWAWGASCWIGSDWCPDRLPSHNLPHLGEGRGVHRLSLNQPGGRPAIANAFNRGSGVHGNDAAETCADRRQWLTDWMLRLADRLRPVRVCCGDWLRVCDSFSTTTRLGLTGVFLDPPYRKTIDGHKNRDANLYANDATQDVDALCDDVQRWCAGYGNDPLMRIALCGLEGEYPELDHWECLPWKTRGGYSNVRGKTNDNAARERIWFSPHCLKQSNPQQNLF